MNESVFDMDDSDEAFFPEYPKQPRQLEIESDYRLDECSEAFHQEFLGQYQRWEKCQVICREPCKGDGLFMTIFQCLVQLNTKVAVTDLEKDVSLRFFFNVVARHADASTFFLRHGQYRCPMFTIILESTDRKERRQKIINSMCRQMPCLLAEIKKRDAASPQRRPTSLASFYTRPSSPLLCDREDHLFDSELTCDVFSLGRDSIEGMLIWPTCIDGEKIDQIIFCSMASASVLHRHIAEISIDGCRANFSILDDARFYIFFAFGFLKRGLAIPKV